MDPRIRKWGAGLVGFAVAWVMLGAGAPQAPTPAPDADAPARAAAPSAADLPLALPAEPLPRPAPALPSPVDPSPVDPSLGAPLVPGEAIQPIDLPGALRLAGVRDLDIAIARERVCQALAEL